MCFNYANIKSLTVRVLDYVQTAVFTSVKCAHYVQILLPGHKRTSIIPLGTSDFTAVDVIVRKTWVHQLTALITKLLSGVGEPRNRDCLPCCTKQPNDLS